MQVEDLELAAEFSKLVGAPSLLEYLGVEPDAPAEEAQARLKARRKFMQGMQGNPKYKREALFLIRHFANLNEVLADLAMYRADARLRAESVHLPVIEMTIRGVLRAGTAPTDDQIAYLRRNAVELGVSETTFRELLIRVSSEMGVRLTGEWAPEATSTPLPAEAKARAEDGQVDLYQLLGVAPTANDDDIRIAHQRKLEQIEAMQDEVARDQMRRRYEIARKVLSNEAARRHYDVTSSRTGPPARAREVRPAGSATVPPAQEREAGGRPARLEILGDPVRTLALGPGAQPGKIVIRNGGDAAMAGTVASEARWLTVEPLALDPDARQQTITVRVDPTAVPEGTSSSAVVITTDRGERARVVFELRRGPPAALLVGVAAVVVFGGLALVLVLSWVF